MMQQELEYLHNSLIPTLGFGVHQCVGDISRNMNGSKGVPVLRSDNCGLRIWEAGFPGHLRSKRSL